MKSIFLFSSRLWVYLTELPVIALLVVAVRNNSAADTVGKLYPLIIALSLVILFIAVYFFRGITVSYDEVRCIGLFSSRDEAIIKKDRSLVITALPKRKIKIEVFGDGGDDPAYEWLRDDTPTEINLFRARAYGSKSSIKKLLLYFDIPTSDIEIALTATSRIDIPKSYEAPETKLQVFNAEYEKLELSVYAGEDFREYRILFKETI